MDDYLYDVAFSFLGKDEHLARLLNDRLKARWSTFIYSDAERQVKVAGRDGELAFADVFGRESRTVVVLYRMGWGTQGFTAPEATGIRNRGTERGYDFATFIPLDNPPSVPPWLPKNRIWFDIDRFGVETAVAVIDSRVQEAFGVPREETPEVAARRFVEERIVVAERAAFLSSTAGVAAANTEFDSLLLEIERVCNTSSGVFTNIERYPGVYGFTAGGTQKVLFELRFEFSNSTEDMKLSVEEWNGSSMARRYPGTPGTPAWKAVYEFWLGPAGEKGWREKKRSDAPFLTSARLADAVALKVIERLRRRYR